MIIAIVSKYARNNQGAFSGIDRRIPSAAITDPLV